MDSTLLDIEDERHAFEKVRSHSKFREKFLDSWTFHESALEGQNFSHETFDQILGGAKAEHAADNRIYRQIRIVRSLIEEVFDKKGHQLNEIDLDWLKQLHCRLSEPFGDVEAGAYRQQEVSPGVYYLDVVEPSSIEQSLDKLLERTAPSQGHPIETASQFHFEFMSIFPFDARTGLIGRLALNKILIDNGYPPAVIHKTERDSYFSALKNTSQKLNDVIVKGIQNTGQAARQHLTDNS